jgi:hypothetical protein
MSATVEINGIRAIITGGEWECRDKKILQKLNDLYPSSCLPDEVNAREAVDALKGSLIAVGPDTEDEENEDGTLVIH